MTPVYVFLGVLAVVVFIFVAAYNGLVHLRNKVTRPGAGSTSSSSGATT